MRIERLMGRSVCESRKITTEFKRRSKKALLPYDKLKSSSAVDGDFSRCKSNATWKEGGSGQLIVERPYNLHRTAQAQDVVNLHRFSANADKNTLVSLEKTNTLAVPDSSDRFPIIGRQTVLVIQSVQLARLLVFIVSFGALRAYGLDDVGC
jgi:hypothetical protein